MTAAPQAAMARSLVAAIAAAFARLDGAGVVETRARLAAQDVADDALRLPAPQRPAALRWLDGALALARRHDAALADALAATGPLMRWVAAPYPAAGVGADFAGRCAWCDVIGPAGLFQGDDFMTGFVLMAPATVYPGHWHPAPELYTPLTGPSLWSRDGGAFTAQPAGARIWHPARMVHAMTTQDAPLLALFAWLRDTTEGPFLSTLGSSPERAQ